MVIFVLHLHKLLAISPQFFIKIDNEKHPFYLYLSSSFCTTLVYTL